MTYRKRRAAERTAADGLPVEAQAAPGSWEAGAASVLGVLAAARHDGLPTKVKPTLESLRAAIEKIEASPPRAEPFSPTRYPYTYACDYFKEHAYEFGWLRGHPSRSDVSRFLLFTFGETEVEAAATLLADAYLREHHIELDRTSMKKAG